MNPRKIVRQFYALIAIFVLPFSANAQELVTGLSHESIYITSDFTGTDLFVFGTINNLQEHAKASEDRPTMGHYDIVVVIEGPIHKRTVRKKDRTLGIWINRDSIGFDQIPDSYLMMTSKLHDEKALNYTLKNNRIGIENISFEASVINTFTTSPRDFREAVIRLKREDGLYWQGEGVSFLADNLFRARFRIPALIPVGTHKVHSHLFENNKLVSKSSHTVEITKTGFEQLMFDFSRDFGYLYGIMCVVLAIMTGWLSGLIFRRD